MNNPGPNQLPPKKKPHTSSSALKMFFRCGEMYRRRHIEREPMIPTVPLIKGSGVHGAAEMNFKQKIESFKDLPIGQIKDAAVASFEARIKQEGVMLTSAEETVGLDKIVGLAKDRTSLLAGLYADFVAPAHQPIKVEEYQRIALNDNLDLLVKLDLINTREEIVDYKTSKKSLNQAEIDQDIQYTLYSLAQRALTGKAPGPVVIENLVDTGKNVKHNQVTTSRGMNEFQAAVKQINLFLDGLKFGVFLPAPKGSWFCNEEHCGYARTCKFYQFYKRGGGDAAKPFWWGRKKKKPEEKK